MATAKSPAPAVDNYLSLLIVAKAKMKHNFCYMGYDEGTNKLVRPLHSAEKDKQWWPRDNDFTVGETIEFKEIERYPKQSSLPHKNDDFHVQLKGDEQANSSLPTQPSTATPAAMFETLSDLGFDTVEAVFGRGNIVEDNSDKFVREGTDCPSAGIYSCKGKNIELKMKTYNGRQKKRCIIKEPLKQYNLSITAESSYQQPESDDSVLLLLGLARPWVKRGQIEKEKRCYPLVLGMITKPYDSATPQDDQLAAEFDTLEV